MTAKNTQGGMKQNDGIMASILARLDARVGGIYSSIKFAYAQTDDRLRAAECAALRGAVCDDDTHCIFGQPVL